MNFLRLENVSRMFDKDTWIVIEHARDFITNVRASPVGIVDWKNAVFWLVRCEYPNVSEAYSRDFSYMDPALAYDKVMKNAAYNHQCVHQQVP